MVAALAGALALVLLTGDPARGHTDLEFTVPTDGAVVGEPVREITVGFSDPVTLVGPGFEVLDPQGNILVPFAATDDDRVFRLQLDAPIGGGEAAVRYEVRAEDGHTISGGFSFTIAADTPTTTTSTTTTTVPTTSTTIDSPAPTTSDSPTVTSDPTSPPTSTVATTITAAGDPASDDGGSNTVPIVVIVAVAATALGFLIVRARWSGGV